MRDRTTILNAIRSKSRANDASPANIAEEAEALLWDANAARPDFKGVPLVDRFVTKATSERVTATVERLSAMADVPAAVGRYLSDAGQGRHLALQPCEPVQALDWGGFSLASDLRADGGVAVTYAEYGVAETGSLVFRSGADAPILMNFLPLYHLVILRESNLLPYSEDVWPHLGGRDAPQPRLLTLVTGTSGTADIEARNVRGAHGPRFMNILLVAE